MSAVSGLNHVTLAVRRVERSVAFYRDVLGFAPAAVWRTGAYLTAGDLWLALIEDRDRPATPAPDYSHLALTCAPAAFDALAARIESEGAKDWSENRSEGASRYFLDPDGHKLEVHVGDLRTRLAAMRRKPWDEITFYPIAD